MGGAEVGEVGDSGERVEGGILAEVFGVADVGYQGEEKVGEGEVGEKEDCDCHEHFE